MGKGIIRLQIIVHAAQCIKQIVCLFCQILGLSTRDRRDPDLILFFIIAQCSRANWFIRELIDKLNKLLAGSRKQRNLRLGGVVFVFHAWRGGPDTGGQLMRDGRINFHFP